MAVKVNRKEAPKYIMERLHFENSGKTFMGFSYIVAVPAPVFYKQVYAIYSYNMLIAVYRDSEWHLIDYALTPSMTTKRHYGIIKRSIWTWNQKGYTESELVKMITDEK